MDKSPIYSKNDAVGKSCPTVEISKVAPSKADQERTLVSVIDIGKDTAAKASGLMSSVRPKELLASRFRLQCRKKNQ